MVTRKRLQGSWRIIACFVAGVGAVVSIWSSSSSSASAAAAGRLPHGAPEDVGLDAERLQEIDQVVAEGLKAKRMPGCVVLIARRGQIAFLKAYGNKQVGPEPVSMTTDTLFDMASITKPVATATSVMILLEQGKLRLDDPVARHVPEFGQNGKDQITIFQLLTHQGGLTPDNSLKDYADGPQKAWERIFALGLREPPGTKFIYTDVGYMMLAEVVRRIAGQNVHEFSQANIFGPLGMTETGYLPDEPLRRRAAPTEKRNDRWMRGEVHDPRAFALGGIAGHAGLFSSAEDLAVYAQMMLGGGHYAGRRVLGEPVFRKMTAAYPLSSGLRGLGWDKKSGYSSNRGQPFSSRAFGHGGFTGTTLWIDPGLDLIVIFLSNRVHPDGKGAINPLAGRIGTIAAEAIVGRDETSEIPTVPNTDDSGGSPERSVLTGIDVLHRDGYRRLNGRKVGLITNHTGVSRQGVSTARLLFEASNVNLVALFSPEHGLEGKLDVARIGDSRHAASGLPVYSLYGETRRPTPKMLEGIDTLVFDIQDIGTRFYTYISTMGQAMRAAAERDIRFVVLDRPNPINGLDVAGPVLDAGRETFVGFHRIPVRHGMTIGELARMFNEELGIGVDLQVVRVEGWRRSDFFDATGLTWINPSPNMRNLNEAILYPGIGLLETTNLSVGRGTDTPFEILGAPWIDPVRLAVELTHLNLPGIRFVPVRFTPDSSKYAGESCGGLNFIITNRATFRPVHTGLQIARQLRLQYPQAWKAESYDRLLRNKSVLDAILAGKPMAEIESIYRAKLQEFLSRRSGFLLYK